MMLLEVATARGEACGRMTDPSGKGRTEGEVAEVEGRAVGAKSEAALAGAEGGSGRPKGETAGAEGRAGEPKGVAAGSEGGAGEELSEDAIKNTNNLLK